MEGRREWECGEVQVRYWFWTSKMEDVSRTEGHNHHMSGEEKLGPVVGSQLNNVCVGSDERLGKRCTVGLGTKFVQTCRTITRIS